MPYMELVDCLRFQNLGVGNETGIFLSKCLVIWLVSLVCLLVGQLVLWQVTLNWLTNYCIGHLLLLVGIFLNCEPFILIMIYPGLKWIQGQIKCMKTVTYTTNFFIGLNMQQRRHVSALFYGAIFRSSMVTKEEIQQTPWGLLYIVGKCGR